jgi:DAACS family dicarboxylate/amino acid:cation (Na+ or H+) symporter
VPARIPLHIQILIAIGVGLVVGPLLGKGAFRLGEIGVVVIGLIKAAAAPLLFFAVVSSLLKTEIRGRSALHLLFWALLNASIALGIGLLLSNLFTPGRSLLGFARDETGAAITYANKTIDLFGILRGAIPSSFAAPFVDNLVLPIVVLALLFGFGLRRVRANALASGSESFRVVEDGVTTMLSLTEVVLGWVIRLIPLAVFGVVARSVGEHGYAPLRGLFVYTLIGVGGLTLHVIVTYQLWVFLISRVSLKAFWREAKEPVTYALGANSSLATLPVTLRALDRLRVPRSASTLGACVGTNFNNDGIILYEGMALLFVAQASGIDLSLAEQLTAALLCMIAAMGVAGVPEAGFVSLALVLNTVGLPVEILPLLLTVDWIIARGRSATNVLSDMVLSLLIARSMNEAPADDATSSATSSPTEPRS